MTDDPHDSTWFSTDGQCKKCNRQYEACDCNRDVPPGSVLVYVLFGMFVWFIFSLVYVLVV